MKQLELFIHRTYRPNAITQAIRWLENSFADCDPLALHKYYEDLGKQALAILREPSEEVPYTALRKLECK